MTEICQRHTDAPAFRAGFSSASDEVSELTLTAHQHIRPFSENVTRGVLGVKTPRNKILLRNYHVRFKYEYTVTIF